VSRWSKVSIGAISMGQELASLPSTGGIISTMANDGSGLRPVLWRLHGTASGAADVCVSASCGAARDLSMTAAQMRQMLEGGYCTERARKPRLQGTHRPAKLAPRNAWIRILTPIQN